MTLRVGHTTCSGIGINLVEQWRIVREVEGPRERVERSRCSVQIIVVQFPAPLAAKLEGMVPMNVGDDIANFESLLRENSGSSFRLVGTKPNTIPVTQHIFKFNSRNTEICLSR